jgi:hypothetical protein
MDLDDSTARLGRLGASNRLTRRVTPVLGLTRRRDELERGAIPAIKPCTRETERGGALDTDVCQPPCAGVPSRVTWLVKT